MCCSVVQCVAVCCSVLQCGAVCAAVCVAVRGDGSRVPKGLSPADLFFVKRERERQREERERKRRARERAGGKKKSCAMANDLYTRICNCHFLSIHAYIYTHM